MDAGEVQAISAIKTQQQIGWWRQSFFMGKLSKKQLKLQISCTNMYILLSLRRNSHWNCLQNYIDVWEQQNKDVYRHIVKEQAQALRAKPTTGIRTLYTL
mmetsp:Transcript_27977/g.61637  ORF Transcript_27977/g.61637 Transcript_27977/m.61637 type:complete len:100 (-) Transcript_27977:289-588(-)